MNRSEIIRRLKGLLKQEQKKALKILEVEGVRSIDMNFSSGGRPKWIPSKKIGKSAEKKYGNKTLIHRGNLKKVSSNIVDGYVILTTNPISRRYASIQHFGGTINRRGGTMARRTMKGRTGSVFASKRKWASKKKSGSVRVGFFKSYSIRIPARPFMVVPREDYPRILSAMERGLRF